MSKPIAKLILFIAVCCIYPYSAESVPRYSFYGWYGLDETRIDNAEVSPGGVIEVDLSNEVVQICFSDNNNDCSSPSGVPAGLRLVSQNPSVASVNNRIELHRIGSARLKLMKNSKTLATFSLKVRPTPVGTFCNSIRLFEATDIEGGLADCSGKCVPSFEFQEKYGDDTCDDGHRGVDLSCLFVPEGILGSDFIRDKRLIKLDFFEVIREGTPPNELVRIGDPTQPGAQHIELFYTFDESSFNSDPSFGLPFGPEDPSTETVIRIAPNNRFSDPLWRDGGKCSPKQSCRAQFQDAPGFEFCSAGISTCTFNAKTARGTCSEMCQKFGALCVGANRSGNKNSCRARTRQSDCQTVQTRQICICERR